MRVSRRYLAAIVLLAVCAVAFGVFGTVAPPLAEEIGSASEPESPSESVGHFQNPPTYDSGWVNITNRAGEYFTMKHGLNTTNVLIDIKGKQRLDSIGGSLEWNRTYGRPSYDCAWSMVQASDGGYALAGETLPYEGNSVYDFWLVKTNSTGQVQWNRTYGGEQPDYAYSVVQSSDGGFALAGGTNSYPSGRVSGLLVKTNSIGEMVWYQVYHCGSGSDCIDCLIQTSDGGYALAGYANMGDLNHLDFWLVKTDPAGNMVWNKTYGGVAEERVWSLIQAEDGGYVMVGHTGAWADNMDLWLVKTDDHGNMLWNRTYGGAYTEDAGRGRSLVQTPDGGYALVGYTWSYGSGAPTSSHAWLVKTDSAGNPLWNITYGGTDSWASAIAQTFDGGYASVGFTYFEDTEYDFWLVKITSTGVEEWNQTYKGVVLEFATCLVQTPDGGYALAGYYEWPDDSDFMLVKTGGNMNEEHQRNYCDMKNGLTWTGLTNYTITLYRAGTDQDWNYVRVRIWLIQEPSWIYGDINMDGVVDAEDLYIIGRNYGKTFSLLSLTGIIAVAGVHTVKKRKQVN